MGNKKIRIGIVDDHPVVMQGLQLILDEQTNIEIVGQYERGADLLDGLKKSKIDVVILDIKLPDIPGDELISKILEKHRDTNILVLTYLDNLYYVRTMIRQGALGYVLKTSGKDTLLEAITLVANGEQYIESQIKETLLQHALISKKESRANTVLTKREKEILQLIASNLSSQQIANKLFVSLKTIEFHRSNLLLKLKAKNAAALVKKAMQMNLIEF
jgi:DNA-binding NarL/FixJ family response regulator